MNVRKQCAGWPRKTVEERTTGKKDSWQRSNSKRKETMYQIDIGSHNKANWIALKESLKLTTNSDLATHLLNWYGKSTVSTLAGKAVPLSDITIAGSAESGVGAIETVEASVGLPIKSPGIVDSDPMEASTVSVPVRVPVRVPVPVTENDNDLEELMMNDDVPSVMTIKIETEVDDLDLVESSGEQLEAQCGILHTVQSHVVLGTGESQGILGRAWSHDNLCNEESHDILCEAESHGILDMGQKKRQPDQVLVQPEVLHIEPVEDEPNDLMLQDDLMLHMNMQPKKHHNVIELFPNTNTEHENITHTQEKPYKCDQCKITFNSCSALDKHKTTHTGDKLYTCGTCNKSFIKSSTLVRHKKTHTGEKEWKCDQCHESFCHLSILTVHRRTHTGHKSRHSGEKLWKCDQCNESFTIFRLLAIHKRTHFFGLKPHICDLCNEIFPREELLVEHKRTHVMYKCNLCHESFPVLSLLEQHKWTSHTNQRYKLDKC